MGKKARFSKGQIAIMVISLLLMFGTKYVTPPVGLTVSGLRVLSILVSGLIMWLFISVDWTSILVLMALMMIPELGVNAITAGSLGNSTVYFLILCFMLSASLSKTGVAHRLAVWFMTSKFSQRGPWYTIGMIFLAIFILSSGLSSTSTLMVFLPILYEIFETLGYKKDKYDKFPGMMITGLVVVSQIAQSTTPISHAMTLIGMSTYTSYTGNTIEFSEYVAVCLPIGILAIIAWFLLCRFVWKPDVSRMASLDFAAIKDEIGPMSKPEKIAGGIYLITIILWVMPGISKYLFPAINPFFNAIHQNYPPTIGILLLHFIKVDGEPVMDYKDASKAVPWNTAIFMGAILVLGTAFSNADIGLSGWVSDVLSPAFSNINGTAFIIIMVTFAVVVTNFMSNAVTIAIASAIALPLCGTIFAAQVNPALLSILMTCGISYAFATPPATPPVAVAVDSGWVSGKSLFIQGMTIAFISIVLISAIGMLIGNVIFAN